MTIGRFGMPSPNLEGVSEGVKQEGSKVCPFTPESKNEDEIASSAFPSDLAGHDVLGKHKGVYAGRVGPSADIEGSSSGGLTSWTALELLRRNEVDGIIHVGPSETSLFAYTVSYSAEDITSRRKSMYFATSFDEVLLGLKGNGKRYAFIGVPCFVRAARLVADGDPVLKGQLVYFLGLVCGHLKSPAFAQLLAWQTGVKPNELSEVDFRVKATGRNANDYDFGARRHGELELRTAPTRSLVGGNWGHGMFQPEACNFCDDIFAETADVVFGDAWLPEYEKDSRGTNVVVSRNELIDNLLQDAHQQKVITLENLLPDSAAKSQAGNFRHRRIGLSVRLADDAKAGLWVPPKRTAPSYRGVSRHRIRMIRQRRLISASSHKLFEIAKKRDSLEYYLKSIDPMISEYEEISKGSKFRRVAVRFRAIIRGLRRSL